MNIVYKLLKLFVFKNETLWIYLKTKFVLTKKNPHGIA